MTCAGKTGNKKTLWKRTSRFHRVFFFCCFHRPAQQGARLSNGLGGWDPAKTVKQVDGRLFAGMVPNLQYRAEPDRDLYRYAIREHRLNNRDNASVIHSAASGASQTTPSPNSDGIRKIHAALTTIPRLTAITSAGTVRLVE